MCCASKKGLVIDLFTFDFMGGVRGYSVVLVYGVHNTPLGSQDWFITSFGIETSVYLWCRYCALKSTD